MFEAKINNLESSCLIDLSFSRLTPLSMKTICVNFYCKNEYKKVIVLTVLEEAL